MDARFAAADAKLERMVGELRAEMDARFAATNTKLDEHIAKLQGAIETRLERRIGRAEARLIRWAFALWAPTTLAVVGLMIGVLAQL